MIARLAALWRRARVFLIVLTASACSVGIYATWLTAKDWWLVFWPWLVAGTIPLVAFVAWWLWWRLPRRQANRLQSTMPDTKARADVEDNFRKTVGQLLGSYRRKLVTT
jgi:membrane protein implicated in regulation of membrane protease activity